MVENSLRPKSLSPHSARCVCSDNTELLSNKLRALLLYIYLIGYKCYRFIEVIPYYFVSQLCRNELAGYIAVRAATFDRCVRNGAFAQIWPTAVN